MEFKEFVQLLYPIIGAGKARYEFTYLVLSKVVDEEGLEILNEIQDSSYKAYYYGNTKITVLSRKIFQYIDTNGFYIFLNDNPDEVISALSDSFRCYIPEITEDDAVDKITQLLYAILAEAAHEKRKPQKKNQKKKEDYHPPLQSRKLKKINSDQKDTGFNSYVEIGIKHKVDFLFWPNYKQEFDDSAFFPSLTNENTAIFTLTEVMEDIMQYFKEGTEERITDKYLACEILVITEIECIEGKKNTQLELSRMILNRAAQGKMSYLISTKLLNQDSNITPQFTKFLNSTMRRAVSAHSCESIDSIIDMKSWTEKNLPRKIEITDVLSPLPSAATSFKGLTLKDSLDAMHSRQKETPRFVSEHRKKHAYPMYTISSFDKTDYFTIIYEDNVCLYRNNEKLFELPMCDITGIVFNGQNILFSKKYDNSIYTICPYGGNDVKLVGEISNFKSITILKYVNNEYIDTDQTIKKYIPNAFLVIEASENDVDFNNCHSSQEGETMTFAYDFENNKILFPIPIAYLSDMAIPFHEETFDPRWKKAVLLGDGCDGTDYREGESAEEVFLKSIKFNYLSESCREDDKLEIISYYDSFYEEMHAYPQSSGKMKFPLFQYIYNWLCEYSNTLSSEGKYVVYYCEDILGVIISNYQDGRVYRIFRLPEPYRNLSLKDREGVKLYFNEISEILTILIDGTINRYHIQQKTVSLVDKLNSYYDKNTLLRKSDDLNHDGQFKLLFYDAIADVICTPVT